MPYIISTDDRSRGLARKDDPGMVEARFIAWIDLARIIELDCGDLCAVPNQEILDAYNARS
jgi:hypothetical protein